MSKVWGFTQNRNYWTAFFNTSESYRRREPLLWTCQHDPLQKKLLRELVQIYDPFIGFALPNKVATCLGVLNTRGYLTTNGLTIELLPLEAIPNPIPLSTLVTTQTLSPVDAKGLVERSTLYPLEISHWAGLKTIIAETNPMLTTSLVRVENWRQRRDHLEYILEIVAQRSCSEEQEQELFSVLRTLTQGESDRPEFSEQLALQTQLRVALKAQFLPAREWEQLCKNVVDAWYGYVMTLTPEEVNRLMDLDREVDL